MIDSLPEIISAQWPTIVAPYRQASVRAGLYQLLNTLVPFCIVWYVLYRSLAVSYWLTLLLAPLEAGLMMRLFIIFHDCGHGSFFPQQRWNNLLGAALGVVCLTPYRHWRHFHAIHHASSSDLDRRVAGELLPVTMAKYSQSIGGVLTLTVAEYQRLSPWERWLYRAYRHPLTLFGVIPALLFIVFQRFPDRSAHSRVRWSVYGTNIAMLGLALPICAMVGWRAFVLIELPVVVIGATIGMWLFYVQHQFEDTYWAAGDTWSYQDAALHGSSFYRLPGLLRWFTGNIGFHHVHHLSPRIPNYRLAQCHASHPLFDQAAVLTLGHSLRCLGLRLWDEDQKKLVGWPPR